MAERKDRLSLLSALGDGLLLLCAMLGFTLSFLSLYGDGSRQAAWQATVLDQCAAWWDSFLVLAAVFALAALAVWSLPRFRGFAAGGTAAFLGAAAVLSGERVVQGAGLTVSAVSTVFSRRVSWGREFLYDPGLTKVEAGAAARLFLTLALAGLALALGWAVVRGRRWWVVLALTLPPLLPGLLADLYPNWPAFMALSACWCAMLLTDLCKWAAADRRGRLTLVMLPAVALVLAAISLLFPREGYTRPDWALHLETELHASADRATEFFSQFDGPFRSTITYVGWAEEVDLSAAGPLSYTGRTLLRVSSDYDGRLYLRGASLAGYDGGRWRALPEGAYQDYLDRTPPQHTTFPLLFPGQLGRLGPSHTVTVDNVGAVGGCVYTPYFLTDQDWAAGGMLPMEDAFLARVQGQWVHTVSFVEADYDGSVHGQDGAYRDFVREHYLEVPAELRDALDDLCGDMNELAYWSGDAPEPTTGNWNITLAQWVAWYLDELCEYDLEAPAAPEGADPVLWFLNDSRRGYCMHFASAAVLMLRAMNVPARYVSGFTAPCRPGRQVDVPDRAAHAWVEVWADGFGWYPVEITPAAAFEWEQAGPSGPDELPSESIPVSQEPEPTPTPTHAPTQRPNGETQSPEDEPEIEAVDIGALKGLAQVLAAVAGTLFLLWLVQFLPKRYRAKRLSAPDRNRAALDGYGYLRRMERWGGRMDPRAVELAQKARFSQHTLTGEELGEMRTFVERERERLCVVLGPVQRLAFRYFWGMPRRKKERQTRKKQR